jgi:RNA polymerase sigma-70 factor (ECF subfamily)
MEEREFEALVLGVQEKALRLAHSYLEDWEDARDAVQEAFMKAYRQADRFRGDAGVTTWFYRILVNHCTDRLRKRKVRSWLTLWRQKDAEDGGMEAHPDPGPGPAEVAEAQAFRADLRTALGRLPRRQREVFRLKAVVGLSLSEVAVTLGISEGTVKTHLFRATRALQEALEPWREQP